MGLSNLLLALLASLTLSEPISASAVKPSLKWKTCNPGKSKHSKAKLECSSLQVPRDYTAPKSKERVTIELVRAKAKKQPSRGSILYNPGGPGLPMRSKISTDSELLQCGTGPLPFTCGAIGPMLSQQKPNDTLEEIWGRAGAVAAQCAKHSTGNKHAELLGTVALVRDTMQVVDALAEDGLLRFWGYSYGTIVGATAAAMFPDRIDRMVLDGVVNPHKWYRGPSDPDMTMDADKVLTAMLEMCIALGETKCPLAKHGSTAADLSAKVWRRIDDLKVQPAVITIKPKAGLSMPFPVAIKVTIDYLKAIHLTSSTLINRALWPQHLSFLASLLAVRGSEPYEAASGAAAPDVAAPSLAKRSAGDANALLSAHIAIRCGDRLERTPAFASFAPEMAATLNSSRISGARFAAIGATCAQWPWRAREAYDGDFAVTTRTPVLVVSSELDPRTPLEAARRASAALGGSELLTVAGAGHCSTSAPSACAAVHLRDYWVNGTMPAPGKVCKGSPFGVKWADVRKEVDKMGSLHKREAHDDFDDDDFGSSFMESRDVMDYFLETDIMDSLL
ncbi:putative hydrolase like protein [Verticillium longisporum]|nr:putative hydrolase like protein [Verticillium longisporum]